MRVVMPAGAGNAQIIQTQLMPQAMLKQGTVSVLKSDHPFHFLRIKKQIYDCSIRFHVQILILFLENNNKTLT